MSDTRAAYSSVLTPPGAGAIAVIRVGGPDGASIIKRVFRAPTREYQSAPLPPGDSLPQPGRLRYGKFVADDEVIDDVVLSTVDIAGASVWDICTHGGVRVVERVLETLDRSGAPLRHSTERAPSVWAAFDRIEREIVEALQRARTERSVRFLARQRRTLACSLAEIAKLCRTNPARGGSALQRLLDGYDAARVLLAGATITIFGPPNTGKSTLFNRLVGRPAAVVSSRAGTTRDWVSSPIEVEGIPITLVDTAGWHGALDDLEREAVHAGLGIVRRARLALLVLDGSVPVPDFAKLFGDEPPPERGCLVIANKEDLGREWRATDLAAASGLGAEPLLWVSAQTGTGIKQLVKALVRMLGLESWDDHAPAPALFTVRQAELAARSLSDLPADGEAAETLIKNELIGGEYGDFIG